ncbi:MAG TPA: HAMP domain-containing methyl-accepting chemotaxis protein [Azospirillum sp.]|nr:HAMP domain-containing methyl-accepting chemotaxis protein [Azospirillum sp.]
MSMSKRIFGGVALLMGLFIALGIVSVSGLKTTERRVSDLVATSQAAADFAELRNLASEVEAAVQTAIRSSQVQDIESARAGLGGLSRSIEGILSNSGRQGNGAALSNALNVVGTEFNRTIATVERRRVLMEKATALGISLGTTGEALNALASAAGDAAFAAVAARVRSTIDNSRFLIARFALSNSPTDAGLAVDETAKMSAAYAEITGMAPPTPRTKRFIAALESDIKALPAITADLIAATTERGSAAASLTKALGLLRNAAEAETTLLNDRRASVIEESLSAQRLLENAIIVVTVVLTAVGGLMGWWGGRSITTPITGMTAVMHKLANEDLTVDIPALERRDEIGRMAKAVQVFKDNAIAVGRLRAEQAEAEMRAARERRGAMDELAHDFQSHVSGVVNLVGTAAREMGETSRSMAAISQQATQQVATVAAAAEQASGSVKTVAAATEELSSSTAEIGRRVTHANATATDAAQRAAQTNTIVRSLAEAAQRIGEIVSMISGIAGQTNMLALNATIEAARAGEAGRGFAVVAGEVKTLANQTAHATSEISGQVSAIQQVTQQAVEAIREIGATIDEISKVSSVIASAVERQQEATREIARSADMAAKGTSEVIVNIGSVTKVVAAAGQAAAQVLRDTEILSQTSAELSTQTDNFVERIRVG